MTGHVKCVGDIEGWGTGECQRKTLISQVVLKKMPKVLVRPNSGKYMPVQKKIQSNPIVACTTTSLQRCVNTSVSTDFVPNLWPHVSQDPTKTCHHEFSSSRSCTAVHEQTTNPGSHGHGYKIDLCKQVCIHVRCHFSQSFSTEQ